MNEDGDGETAKSDDENDKTKSEKSDNAKKPRKKEHEMSNEQGKKVLR